MKAYGNYLSRFDVRRVLYFSAAFLKHPVFCENILKIAPAPATSMLRPFTQDYR